MAYQIGRRLKDKDGGQTKKKKDPFYGLTKQSAKCMTKCLGRDGVFCAMAKTEFGFCCKSAAQCKKFKVNFCSYEAPPTSLTLKLWSCPHTPRYCGSNEMLIGSQDGKNKVLRPKRNFKSFLNNGAACRYKILFPANAG